MQSPTITIGMPSKNRIFCIEKVLMSLSSQNYPKNKTCIIFIDESTDGTYEKIIAFSEKFKQDYLRIEILSANSQGYISILRNICISHMEGEAIVFWDSDVWSMTDDALSLTIQKLFSNDAIGSAGYNYERASPSFYEKLLRLRAELGGMGFTAIKKTMFETIGLFNEKLRVNEDTEFLSRMKLKGFQVILVSETPLLHIKPAMTKRISLNREISELKNQVKSAYSQGSLVWEECIKQGSWFDFARAIYYIAFPLFLAIWVINFFSQFCNIQLLTLFFALYFSINVFYHLQKIGKICPVSLIATIYYIPLGMASGYGLIARWLNFRRTKN